MLCYNTYTCSAPSMGLTRLQVMGKNRWWRWRGITAPLYPWQCNFRENNIYSYLDNNNNNISFVPFYVYRITTIPIHSIDYNNYIIRLRLSTKTVNILKYLWLQRSSRQIFSPMMAWRWSITKLFLNPSTSFV